MLSSLQGTYRLWIFWVVFNEEGVGWGIDLSRFWLDNRKKAVTAKIKDVQEAEIFALRENLPILRVAPRVMIESWLCQDMGPMPLLAQYDEIIENEGLKPQEAIEKAMLAKLNFLLARMGRRPSLSEAARMRALGLVPVGEEPQAEVSSVEALDEYEDLLKRFGG